VPLLGTTHTSAVGAHGALSCREEEHLPTCRPHAAEPADLRANRFAGRADL